MATPVLLLLLFLTLSDASFTSPHTSLLTRSTISFPHDRASNIQHPTQLLSSLRGNDLKIDVSIGFLGCGTIASAIATGLATQNTFPTKIKSISVTQRNESKSSVLKQTFPHLVTVVDRNDSNQDVLDQSDVVFLCVLPQKVDEILSKLQFDSQRHTLVSLVATTSVDELISLSGLPPDRVYKMICLPPVAHQEGMCLIVPSGNSFLKSMFDSLGGCIECKDEAIMRTMMVPNCLMGPMYGILKNNRDWLIGNGVPAQDASYFLGKQYLSMVQDAERECKNNSNHFDDLILVQTPGGLNEQSLKNLDKMGVYEAYNCAMDSILSRLEGKTDGNISGND